MKNPAHPELMNQKIRSALFQPFPDSTYNSGIAVQTTGTTSVLGAVAGALLLVELAEELAVDEVGGGAELGPGQVVVIA